MDLNVARTLNCSLNCSIFHIRSRNRFRRTVPDVKEYNFVIHGPKLGDLR